ncbi:MAG: site-2 protease family protein [Thermoguttaceae bacterium]
MLYVIGWIVVVLMVAFGLGFVVFVHELGHFLVAKCCGVKCEKFYLGFDFGGLKFCKFQWGETEYGIGIFPLGGYVKMLGQEDNPARLREEMERAQTGNEGRGTDGEPTAEAHAPGYDPRSFLAQSVPKRMAIVSAGVVMNLIFAFVLAVTAYWIHVEQSPCIVGGVFPGLPAWQAGLRAGDEILEIGGKPMREFRDLQKTISLGDLPEGGVPMLVRRRDASQPLTITVKPDQMFGAFFVGVSGPNTNRLADDRKTWLVHNCPAVWPGTAAAAVSPGFQNGDVIIAIDGKPVDNYAQINAALARTADKTINVTVKRRKGADSVELKTIPVAPNPVRQLGLVLTMGDVTAVQPGSPAAKAGIQPGDRLEQVDGRPIDDPMRLPDQLNAQAGKTVRLTLDRKGSPVVVSAALCEPSGSMPPQTIDAPVGVESLGLAYHVLNRVERVLENGPAAKAGLRAGDLLLEAKIEKKKLPDLDLKQKAIAVPFNKKERSWPTFFGVLQTTLPGTSVDLTFLRGDEKKTVTLKPTAATDWFTPDRGFVFEPMRFVHGADSFGQALRMGGRETLDSLTMVFRSLRALGTAQVSARNLVGPVGIVGWAVDSADQGAAKLLLFLTMLSANLAVLNFLPIPVLDGGLMMFLIYEGVRGKPANEHVQVVLTYLGLALILVLTIWVFGLDFGWIPRR